MSEICDEIIKRRINIKWTCPNGIALWTLDEHLMEKMRRSGCYRLTFGIESGNRETQKFIGKNLDLNKARSVIKTANKIGLWTISTNIIGFPYEDRKAIEDTINYAINSDTDFSLFYPLTPFRGSPVYEIFEKEKLIPNDVMQNNNFFVTEFTRSTKYFTQREIEEIEKYAYSKFISARMHSYLKNPIKIGRAHV